MASVKPANPHRAATAPSAWVRRFAGLVPPGGSVLDLACGGGRHSRFFLERGCRVTALDRDVGGLADLGADPALADRLEILEADLEDGSPFPLTGRSFDAVVVTRYLYRPILPDLLALLPSGGLLIYETFALGNERFGKPSNPDFLLRPGELLEAVRGELRVLAYEDLIEETPQPAAIQRICARREG